MLPRLFLFTFPFLLHNNLPQLSRNLSNAAGNINAAQSTEIQIFDNNEANAELEYPEDDWFCSKLPPGVKSNSPQKISTTQLSYNSLDSVFQKKTILKANSTSNENEYPCLGTETIGDTTIEWFIYKNKWAYSCPPCLGSNNKVIMCTQVGKEFVRYEQCAKFQKPISYCPDTPDGFEEGENECCLILEADTFDKSSCPYNYQKSFYSIDCLPTNEPVWFPAKRKFSDRLGQFYNLDFNNSYEIVTPDSYNNTIVDSGCIVYNNGTLEAVSCDAKYKRVCSYEYLHLNKMSYCMQSSDRCMNTNYDTTKMTCFCTKEWNETCNRAQFLLPYQNSANFFSKRPCMIGLSFDRNINNYVWSKSGAAINYTNWLPCQPYTDKNSWNYLFIVYNKWLDAPIYDCKICEINYTYKLPKISITIISNLNKISVKQSEFASLVMAENKAAIICLTNGLKNNQISVVASFQSNPFEFEFQESGQYWCEGLEIKHFKQIKSNMETIIIDNIFPMEITFKFQFPDDPTSKKIAYDKYISNFEKTYNENFSNIKAKWMKTLEIDENKKYITYLIHLCTALHEENYMNDYKTISQNLDIVVSKHLVNYTLYNYKFCYGETTNFNNKLTWQSTEVTNSIAPNEICLNKEGKSIVRRCEWHFMEGARWSIVELCHVYAEKRSINTEHLEKLLNSNATTEEITSNLLDITKNTTTFKPIDVYLISLILGKLTSNETEIANATSITTILSNTMTTNVDVLKQSQKYMDATDRILFNFDVILEKGKVQYKDELIETENLIVFIFDSNLPYSGLALLQAEETLKACKLLRDIDSDKISQIKGLQIATFLPREILEDVSLQNDSEIIISFFLENSLFNSEAEQKVVTKAVSILLPPNNKGILVPVIFKPTENLQSREANCSFWGFGNMNSTTKGNWVSENEPNILANDLYQCDFPHCTHFGLLLSHEEFSNPNSETAFDIINIVGVSLSTFGFCGIFLTATIFKNWRQNEGNNILFHFTGVSYIQIVAMHFSEYAAKYYLICIALGAVLHYLVISEFLWMLMIALLQHKRYIKVMQAPQHWILTTSKYICYILPLIPVVYLLLINYDDYVHENINFCYPKGQGLIYTVLFPIGAIVAVNVLIFAQIFLVLSCRRSKACKHVGLKLKLLVLLFFLLGITWIFGFAALFFESELLMAVFVFLAPLQGFIIFLFFIVFNKNVRKLYLKLWCYKNI